MPKENLDPFPQGLKPNPWVWLIGMAEAVPFQGVDSQEIPGSTVILRALDET
jgi:hypothetical protein